SDDEPPTPEKQVQARDRIRDGVDVRDLLFKKSGVDLFAIPGLAADTLLTLASEVGFAMTPWKTEKHFAAWLNLCPGTKTSGGKVLNNKTKRHPNRAAQAFRMAAASLYRSQTALGAFYRRLKSRAGGKQAALNWVNTLMNSVTKSAASIISKFKLSPLAFNWFRAQPDNRVSKKAQRTLRTHRGETIIRQSREPQRPRARHSLQFKPVFQSGNRHFEIAGLCNRFVICADE